MVAVSVRKPTVRMRAVMIPRDARRSDRPPTAAPDTGTTLELTAVQPEQAAEFRELLEAERLLGEMRRWHEDVDEGWE